MNKQGGFSLVELMVAMTVTLIVSAAIYGLLTSGSNAFRREPEVADRQQNIRIAMDLIARDVFNAGASMPTFTQVFSWQDPAGGPCAGAQGFNGCGEAGTLGTAAAGDRAPGDGGDPSTASDILEFVTTAENCPPRTVCVGTPGSAGDLVIREPVIDCLMAPGLVMIANNTLFTIQPAFPAGAGAQNCPGGTAGTNGKVTLAAALPPWTPASAIAVTQNPSSPFAFSARVVRYAIGPSTDPMETTPALWRSNTGRYTGAGLLAEEPGDDTNWQLVARGIEDLQVEYRAGDGVWRNRPPQSVVDDWNTLVREVRITISARVSVGNLQGEMTAEGGPDAIRGQLATVVAPRAAFNELQMGGQIQ